jgi:DNA-binding transcriptional regulator YiaG
MPLDEWMWGWREMARRRAGDGSRAAMSVGDWIRAGRQNQRLTQAELAAYLSVATSTVCRWERGRSRPRFRARRALMTLFGAPPPADRRRATRQASPRHHVPDSTAVRIACALEALAAPPDAVAVARPRLETSRPAGANGNGARHQALERVP